LFYNEYRSTVVGIPTLIAEFRVENPARRLPISAAVFRSSPQSL